MDYCPVTADTARYYSREAAEHAREDFVEIRTVEIFASILASQDELKELLDQACANGDISDSVLMDCYYGDNSRLRSVMLRAARAEAKCRADAEALRSGK